MIRMIPAAAAAVTTALYGGLQTAHCQSNPTLNEAFEAAQRKTSSEGLRKFVDLNGLKHPGLKEFIEQNAHKQPKLNLTPSKEILPQRNKNQSSSTPISIDTGLSQKVVEGIAGAVLTTTVNKVCGSSIAWLGSFSCEKDDQRCVESWRNGYLTQACTLTTVVAINHYRS